MKILEPIRTWEIIAAVAAVGFLLIGLWNVGSWTVGLVNNHLAENRAELVQEVLDHIPSDDDSSIEDRVYDLERWQNRLNNQLDWKDCGAHADSIRLQALDGGVFSSGEPGDNVTLQYVQKFPNCVDMFYLNYGFPKLGYPQIEE